MVGRVTDKLGQGSLCLKRVGWGVAARDGRCPVLRAMTPSQTRSWALVWRTRGQLTTSVLVGLPTCGAEGRKGGGCFYS